MSTIKCDLLFTSELELVRTEAGRAEQLGFDGFLVGETRHDAFVSLALATGSTTTIELGTSIAIAFARTPMTVAIAGYDLQRVSSGRLLLGLGSQIRPHITNRYGMPWSHPAARMREFVCALREIWGCWQHGTKLDFRGDFYTHTLMTPMFDPGPLATRSPRIVVAAVGPQMTRVAAEVADGISCHPLCSPQYLREALVPALADGLAGDEARRREFEVAGMVLVATGRDDAEMAAARAATRQQIAFYASTPAYLPILERHGLAELQAELHALSKQGAWERMGELIDDELLHTFAIVGEPEQLGRLVGERYAGLLDRVSLSLLYAGDELRSAVAASFPSGLRDRPAQAPVR